MLAIFIAAAGCESWRPPAPPPLPTSYDPIDDLTGSWMGTCGGRPLTLVIVEPYPGLYLSPWLIAGGRYPGVSSVFTFSRSGAPVSVGFNGWIYSSRPFTWLVVAEPLDGARSTPVRAGPAPVSSPVRATLSSTGPQGRVDPTRGRKPDG